MYINNESSIDITECDVKLKQEVTYETHDPQHEYRYDKHLIASKKFGNVLRWSRKVYRGILELPSIPPTSAKTKCPITVTYAIKIIIQPTEFHWKMKLKIPVTIGSVPIMESAGNAGIMQANNNRILRQLESVEVAPPMTTLPNEQLIDDDVNQNTTPIVTITEADNPPEYIAMRKFESVNLIMIMKMLLELVLVFCTICKIKCYEYDIHNLQNKFMLHFEPACC